MIATTPPVIMQCSVQNFRNINIPEETLKFYTQPTADSIGVEREDYYVLDFTKKIRSLPSDKNSFNLLYKLMIAFANRGINHLMILKD